MIKKHIKKRNILKAINLDNPLHNKYTPRNIYLGKKGELFGKYALEKLLKIKLQGNDFSNYVNERGADIILKEIGLYVEVKNWAKNYYITISGFKKLIENRFPKNAPIKILLISYLIILTKNCIEYAKSLGII